MAVSDEEIDSLEDLWIELGKVVTNQTTRLLRQDMAISNIVDRIGDLSTMLKDLQSSLDGSRSTGSSRQSVTRSIRLDLLKFQGTNPEGWIFQVEEYFSFHGITDDSCIQIVGFHMTKGALSWMCGLRHNDLLST